MKEKSCLGCQLAKGEVISPGGEIWRDTYWHLAHDVNNFIPGFLVLGTIPHVIHLYEIPVDEYLWGLTVVHQVRGILADMFGLRDFLLYQNDLTSGHFHIWLMPIYPEMNQFSRSMDGMVQFLQWTKRVWKTDEKVQEIDRISEALRQEMKLISIDS